MTAREMFEALGYEFIDCKESIRYVIDDGIDGDYIAIEFYLSDHAFYAQYNFEAKNITVDEFKAIQQQMNELGGFNDNKRRIRKSYRKYQRSVLCYNLS